MGRGLYAFVALLMLVTGGVAGSLVDDGRTAWLADDESNYSGADCGPNGMFDATLQTCTAAVVTNAPDAAPPQQGAGIDDYSGARCADTQFFNGSDQSCAAGVVTNDPQAAVPLEGEDPTQLTVPTVGNIPGCAAKQKKGQGAGQDPFGLCG